MFKFFSSIFSAPIENKTLWIIEYICPDLSQKRWCLSANREEDVSAYIKTNYQDFEEIFQDPLKLGNPLKKSLIDHLVKKGVKKIVQYGMSSPMLVNLRHSMDTERKCLEEVIQNSSNYCLINDLLESQSEYLKIKKIPYQEVKEL